MVCTNSIYHAPANSGTVVLGRTLPALLNEACDRTPNPNAFHQWSRSGWQSLSNEGFRDAARQVGAGLLALGLQRGDRVALLMHSDLNFCIVDLGCLFANLVDVPIDLTQTLEHIIFVLRHSEAQVLIVSNLELLAQIVPYFWETPELRYVIVVDEAAQWSEVRSQWLTPNTKDSQANGASSRHPEIPESACLYIPMMLHPVHVERPHTPFPQCIQLLSLGEVQANGETPDAEARLQQRQAEQVSTDLATIIYIPDEQGNLQGVMLSHENLTANAIASFSGIPTLKPGVQETVLSFLPLNHVLARTLLYGHIHYGHCIYFSNPNRVMKHLADVRPTVLVTVPLFLEKIYSRILDRRYKSTSLAERLVFAWALHQAQRYELGRPPRGLYALLLKLADWLVLSKWRSLFGNRLQYLICGGAALRAEITNVFAAAGVTILQGYGLTQASAVVCCNRDRFNRAGTVGVPIDGTDVAIAEDGEILVRGASITSGYFKNPEATRDLIDADGWLHTGDQGRFTQDGFLQITGLKKSLFKLSTGKYIAPQPIEQRLNQFPFVEHALIVGADQKSCAALIVPNVEALHHYALEIGLDLPIDTLLTHASITAWYQAIVNQANCHLPYWAIVKRFRLIHLPDAMKHQVFPTSGTVNRSEALRLLAPEIQTLFQEDGHRKDKSPTDQLADQLPAVPSIPAMPEAACPAFAQSLNPRLTTLNTLVTTLLCGSWMMPNWLNAWIG